MPRSGSLPCSQGELSRAPLLHLALGADGMYPFIKNAGSATHWVLFQPLVGSLMAYPISHLCISPSDGDNFIEGGSSGGHATTVTFYKECRVVGIDDSAMLFVAGSPIRNAQSSDIGCLPLCCGAISYTSDMLRRLSVYVPTLSIAGGLYISALRLDGIPRRR